MTDDAADRFRSLARELAAMPDLWRRLLTEHTADDAGRCRGCTTPGYGTPGARWPCLLVTLAREAQRLAEADE